MGVRYHLVRGILVGEGWLLIVQGSLGLGLCCGWGPRAPFLIGTVAVRKAASVGIGDLVVWA